MLYTTMVTDKTWPVNSLVAPDGAERGLVTSSSSSSVLETQVTEATVPAPALLLHSSLRSLLLPLEVRLGEGLHGGQKPHLAHLPAQGDRRLALLATVEIHGVGGEMSVSVSQTSPERFAPETVLS